MKHILLITMLLAFGSLLQAQKNVVLNFNHRIDNLPVQFDGTVYNTTNGIFNVNRIQYYLSGFQLVHDGGQIMDLTGLYLLVSGDTASYHLGTYNVSNIEEIRYDVGVDSATNHLDPATYLPGDPLAYQNPSMHWGWSPGYMFFIFMGEASSSATVQPNTTMEFVAVGDQYLTPYALDVSLATETIGNDITIYIKTDYNLMFGKTVMAQIYHGSGGAMDQVMENLATLPVFTPDNRTSIDQIPDVLELSIAPNPIVDKAVITYPF